jgi:hypothetical protein
MNTIKLKIVDVNTDTQMVSVSWASDLSQKSIDEYPTYGFPMSYFQDPQADTATLLRQLAEAGISECQKQIVSESIAVSMPSIITNLSTQTGLVTEYDLGMLLGSSPLYPTEVAI